MFSSISKSLSCLPTALLKQKDRFTVIKRTNEGTGTFICKNQIKGIDYIRNPRLNKGLAFTLKERQALGIHGLLAASFKTQEEQLEICRVSIDRYKDDLNKYLYLAELYDINERLYYTLLSGDIEKYMPIIYTPTVGLACQKFGLAYRKPRGLFITLLDKGHILDIIQNWPEPDVRAICFTDGERILGLGDLGAFGMGIPIGKLALYTILAGVKPNECLPITLDVGTNNKKLISDPLYIGIRQKRATGQEYTDFIEEFMQACVARYGPNTLLQFEDFALQNATPLLEKYRNGYCSFNDDIQGTASVAVAGLLTSVRITGKKMSDNIILFLGAGSASVGIGNLCVDAMIEEGTNIEEARKKIFLFDVDGFLSNKRPSGIPDHATHFGKDMEPETNFEKLVAQLKPTILIGASTVGGAFTTKILNMMATFSERPVVFALSNPTIKAECTAQQCYDHTEGRCVFASGSPFPPVKYKGKTYHTGQGNNAYIFPGVALGVIAVGAHTIPEKFFLRAAQTLANFVEQSDLDVGRIYPPIGDIRKCSFKIAEEIVKLAYEMDVATHFPRPKDINRFVMNNVYDLRYPVAVPNFREITYPEVKLKNIDDLYPTGEVKAGVVKGKPSTKT